MYSLGMNLQIFGTIFVVLWCVKKILDFVFGKSSRGIPQEFVDYDEIDYLIDTDMGEKPNESANINYIMGTRSIF